MAEKQYSIHVRFHARASKIYMQVIKVTFVYLVNRLDNKTGSLRVTHFSLTL